KAAHENRSHWNGFLFCIFRLIFPRGRSGKSKGDSALCGARPGSTWTGQPARLDRAGPRARTRLSPAGGIPFIGAKKEDALHVLFLFHALKLRVQPLPSRPV